MMLLIVGGAILSACATDALAGKKDKKDKKDFPAFDEVVKDMTVSEGFFTLYYDKKKDTLLARIPASMLDEPFLASFSTPKGPGFASSMLGGAALYFEKMDKKLVLIEDDTRYKSGKGSTVEDVIGRTYTDTIVMALDIKTMSGKDPIIDLGDLMKTDLAGLGRSFGGRRMDRSLSRWSKMKAFPDNVELAVDGAFMSASPSGGGVIASLHVSLSRLPGKNGYKPREADDRIGYFMTAQKDWTVDHNAKTVFKRYVHRWHLEKQDPKAAESPVKNPIVYYIEKTVPVPYRRYVREGILAWNDAFEKVGYLNAVQVRQQTETNEFADLDPEDVRYSFFRWIVSGRAFARGPSRANPYTGQLLDADIVMDDSMIRFYTSDYQLQGPRAYDNLSDPLADDFYAQFPEFRFESLHERLTPELTAEVSSYGTGLGFDALKILQPDVHGDPCELGVGMVQQLGFAQLYSATSASRDLPEEFIGQAIKEVVMHEVGHTLGLRHNFKASTWRPLSDITSTTADSRPLTGSVMDYNPLEYAGTPDEQGLFISTELGPYDFWAIEYGYRPFMSGGESKSEQDMLDAIASRVAEEGLQYATDEDTSDFGPDPYVYRFDNGSDPIEFAKHRMNLAKRMMTDLTDRAVEDGESYTRLRRAVNITLGEYSFAARMVARVVGGQSVSRDHKGDPNARDPFEIVPAKLQRDALAFLNETVFTDDAYNLPPELLNKLAPGRFWHWDSDQFNRDVDYNLHDRVLGVQARTLTLLINPININRIHDAELKIPASEDAFTVPELFSTVTDGIFSELSAKTAGNWTNRKPMVSSFRRNLQREYVRRLVAMQLRGTRRGLNPDAHALVRSTLKDIGERSGNVIEKNGSRLDTYTLAHLDEMKSTIAKALDADFVTR